MIGTTKQVLIDAQVGIWNKVYLQVGNRNDSQDGLLIQYDVTMFVLVPIDENTNKFQLYKRGKAIYKRSTHEGLYNGGLKLEQYDSSLIQNIGFVNNKELNNLWTGQEIQRISYWAKPEVGGITINDLEVITPEKLALLKVNTNYMQNL